MLQIWRKVVDRDLTFFGVGMLCGAIVMFGMMAP
jgi:hypothetical protein